MNTIDNLQTTINPIDSRSRCGPTLPTTTEPTPEQKRLSKIRSRRKHTLRLADMYRQLGEVDLARRAEACCSVLAAGLTSGGNKKLIPVNRCNLRFCPSCCVRRSIRLANRFAPVLMLHKARGEWIRFLTLTVPNIKDIQRGDLDELWANWKRLRRQKLFSGVLGTLAVMEVTYNAKADSYHHHLHVILVGGPFIPQDQISDAWSKLTGGTQVDIRAADEDSLKELLKYCVKPSDIPTAKELKQLDTAMRYVNTVRATGVLRGVAKQAELLDESEAAQDLVPNELDELAEVIGFFSTEDSILDWWLAGNISDEELRARSKLRFH